MIAVLLTGGTIASAAIGSQLAKPASLEKFREFFDQLGDELSFDLDLVSWKCSDDAESVGLDSCEVGPSQWIELHEQIEQLLEKYESVVVLHGTDTMAYSASAIALMKPQRAGPVIFTGAQVRFDAPGSDARRNILFAAQCAAECSEVIGGETVIAFAGRIMRGVRGTKTSTISRIAFTSPGFPFISELNLSSLPKPVADAWCKSGAFTNGQLSNFEASVLSINVVPNFDPSSLIPVTSAGGYDAVLLNMFGVGSSPKASELARYADELADMGIPIVARSRCLDGGVDWSEYASTIMLPGSALIPAGDMTEEASMVKLMGSVGSGFSPSHTRDIFRKSLAGEITDKDCGN